MSWRLPSFKARSFLVCLALLLQTGEARVHTETQAGPLYRIVGTPLSISCVVSGFSNADAQKQFEFRITKPAKPTFPFNIISTGDAGFAYAMYSQRVSNGEITLKHVTPNSVLFEIKRLQKDDEGEYECYVINPEVVYDGIYEAKTTVKVIDNSLSVSSPVSSSLSYTEGDDLTLTCQASSNTIQHTHLSFAWYLRKDAEENTQPIISLNRDFTLSPGQGFEGRYQAGNIRLDKIGEATYRLTMAQLELSDQGRLYCQAQEWIQDPDGSWFTITQKEAAEITVDVKAREVIRDTSSLVVRISAQQTTLQEGQELSLSCYVDSHKLEERFLTVAWFRDGVELAHIGPTGVLSVGPEYSGREKEGELRAARIEGRHYRLILQPVRTEDKGEYICQAWPEERGLDGAFRKGNVQKSQISLLVSISATESSFSVEMQPTVSVKEGDRLTLGCKVKGVKGRLSVTWQYQPTSTAAAVFRNIISVNQEGVAETGSEFMTHKVSVQRPAADTFVLELDEVKPTDSGVYHCAVSEWKNNIKTSSQSQNSTVLVAPVETFVKVFLISRKTRVTVGEYVELLCRVRGPNVPVTLTWSLQRDASSVDNILTIYSDGSISWSEDQQGYQLKVENKVNEVAYYLLINSASHREAGNYQCRASAFLENVYKKLPPSNPVAVMVQNPVSKLVLTSSRTVTKDINSDVEINCSVGSASSTSSHYAVTWLHQHQSENRTIVSSDRDAFMTFGSKVELGSRQRISMRRTEGPSFKLTIRQAQISDNGFYVCEVVEWLQDPRGNWYQLPPVSQATKLKLNEPANDLKVRIKEQKLTVTEGQEVELQCDVVSGSFTPSFFYKIAWLYSGHSDLSMIVELDHTGLLRYAENKDLVGLQGRLGLRRPSQSSFTLRIQRAHEEDSGSYWCQVDQYQMNHQGQWQQKASDTAGPIRVAVNVAETNLSLLKHDLEQNVTRSENFIIPCHITQQSSRESEFKVTWFWQKDTETKKRPIFVAYPNATLHDMMGNSNELRFGHPLPNQYSLTVTKPVPENNGLYSCEVEEWLPSLSHGWRKTAVETSGYLTVTVWAEEEPVPEPLCQSGHWIGILVAFAICSLLVILILVIKIFHSKASGGKQSGQSLWAEEHPLKTKPSADD